MTRSKMPISLIALFALTTGCAMNVKLPMTGDEMRQMSQKPTETYEVNKSYKDVSETVAKKAEQCLNISIKTTTHMSNGAKTISYLHYKPTVKKQNGVLTLELQQSHEGGNRIQLGQPKMPEGGMYIVLADVKAAGKSTAVDLYYGKLGFINPYENIVNAVKGWADGSIRGCPDLANG